MGIITMTTYTPNATSDDQSEEQVREWINAVFGIVYMPIFIWYNLVY